MGLTRLLNTKNGRIFISIILGIGIASLFRVSCSGSSCITLMQPELNEVQDKIFRSNKQCFNYHMINEKCNPGKTIVSI